MLEEDFSHVPNFTGYMKIVLQSVLKESATQKILDIPAGQGLLADPLRKEGHEVVCADINKAHPDYVYADLDQQLPFSDGEFDTCICMEGLEHVVDSSALIKELCRITKPGGRIFLTLPNVQNIFSRFTFLCTGYFYQFGPWMSRHLEPGEAIDRGHISPLSFLHLQYLFRHHGAHVASVTGDRWKKKWLIPLMVPFLVLGWVWARLELSRQKNVPKEESLAAFRHLFSPDVLFGRSLILTFVRR